MRFWLPLLVLVFAPPVHAQQDQIPGPPPDEYVDVTGDGIADLLIFTRTMHVAAPEQPGYLGKYILGVRTLSGTTVLMWSTPSTQRWYTLEDSTWLDTGLLAARIHYKQVSWTDRDQATEFWLLERPFGAEITKELDGWYGTGDHHDGLIMVLRSVNERGTSVAAFRFELPFPYGRVVVKRIQAIAVPNGFGKEGDPVPPKPKMKADYDFGHEANEPQVMVPPGVPPDEAIDLTSDDIPDVVITGENAPYHSTAPPLGTYHRGVRMLPGTRLLMARHRDGSYHPYQLQEEETLEPGRISRAMEQGDLRWADPDHWSVLVQVLQQRYGRVRTADEPIGWLPADEAPRGMLVFLATQYGRPMMGCFEIGYTTPGGELWVRLMGLVDEGQVLRAE